jgi:hypothetical protein
MVSFNNKIPSEKATNALNVLRKESSPTGVILSRFHLYSIISQIRAKTKLVRPKAEPRMDTNNGEKEG